ncbi:MAG: insulinase family protein, partial [Fibrobacterales bacterium]|nr:insulinase family protein [Fibrobacterales bacterium]
MVLCAALRAQAPDSVSHTQKEEPAKSLLAVERYELENGMRVLLLPLKRAPIVSCRLFYQTGSVHEHAGNTGIAHLLEHEMFKGT